MDLIINLAVFLFGVCIGSFLNCVVYRLEENKSFVKGRSYCPNCKHTLSWLDLIPVASFLLLKGGCRYCGKKISPQYPIVEIVTGLIFVLIFKYQFSIINQVSIFNVVNFIFLWYIASVLIIIFIYDLKHYLIPDKVLFPAITIALIFRILESIFLGAGVLHAGNFLLAGAIASGFFLAMHLMSKGRWMGFGDVKLAILLGLVLGFPAILLGLFLSFFFGAIIGIILMVVGKKGLKSQLPFAPFLIIGTFIALCFGDRIINWYTHFLIF